MDVVEKVTHAWPEPNVKLHVDVILPGVGWFLNLDTLEWQGRPFFRTFHM